MGQLTFTKPRALRLDDPIDGFSCGVDLIDNWVATRARSARESGTAVVYVTFEKKKLAGFYSLSAQSIVRENACGWIARNAPAQIPVILLGMFGVDWRYQGQGLGHDLLLDAVRRAKAISEQIGAKALVVDPIDDDARGFYQRFGFRSIPGSRRMFAKLA